MIAWAIISTTTFDREYFSWSVVMVTLAVNLQTSGDYLKNIDIVTVEDSVEKL